jgi:predicted RNA binding protein YcfA (HicA-like mRNA interferase family)
MNSKDLIKELKKAGWTVKRAKGSHHQLSHPDYGYVITVPHPKKDLGIGLVKAIRKSAHITN